MPSRNPAPLHPSVLVLPTPASVLARAAPLTRRWPHMAWDVSGALGVLVLGMVLAAAVTDETQMRERTAIRTARAYLADRTPELRHQMRTARVLARPDAAGLTVEIGTGAGGVQDPLALHCVDVVGGRPVSARPCAAPEATAAAAGEAAAEAPAGIGRTTAAR